ncbi:MAG: M48 family peptidase, partial [Treponema sp.]|nr:M48 family peptidase [Treponema sp.]
MKKIIVLICVLCLALVTCVTNPFTGKSTMAFVDNRQLFPSSFAQYDEFLSENTVITGTSQAEMVNRVGN